MKRSLLVALFAAAQACGGTPPEQSAMGTPDDNSPDIDVEDSTAALSSDRAGRWFPMGEGDEWVLKSTTSQRTLRVEYRHNALRFLSGLTANGMWLSFSSKLPNSLYVWNEDGRTWSPFIRFGYRLSAWKVAPSSSPCEQYVAQRAGTDETLKTPAGTFSGIRRIAFTQTPAPNVRCAPGDFQEISFAPDFGPIEIVAGNGETFQLASALLAGEEFPGNTPPFTVSVHADQRVYVNQANTIYCITQPCPTNEVTATATFNLTVDNPGSTAQRFNFASGQQFDFEVVDSNGKVVLAWSDNRAFTMALTTFTLAPGDYKSFTGKVELKDRQGQQLSGNFKVRGKLTTSGQEAPELVDSVPFAVELH